MNIRSRLEYGLTPEQENIYYIEQIYPASTQCLAFYFDIRCELNIEVFVQARNAVVAACDALHLNLWESNGRLNQFVSENDFPSLKVFDYSERIDGIIDANTLMNEINSQYLSATAACLFQDVLIKAQKKKYFYYIKIHHIIIDASGLALYFKCLINEYKNSLIPERKHLDNREIPSFIQHITSGSNWEENGKYQRSRDFWLKEYATLPEPLLNQRYRREQEDRKPESAGSAELTLNKEKYQRIKALADNGNTGVLAFFIGVLYLYFSRVYSRNDIVIGVPTHNRNTVFEKKLVGLLFNVNAVKLNYCDDSLSFFELIEKIKVDLTRIYPYRNFPISHLNRELQLLQHNRRDLFDMVFNYQCFDFSETLNDEPIITHSFRLDTDATPLTFTLFDFGEQQDLVLEAKYNRAYFAEWEIKALLEAFDEITDNLLLNSALDIKKVQLVSERQKRMLLVDWNDTRIDYPRNLCIQELFERQVEETPNNIAVVFEEKKLTYLELNEKANQLAHWLVGQGVRPDSRVAIALERSYELIVAIVASVKAGGAYVPMDPGYPQGRLQFMLANSTPEVLVTTPAILPRLGNLPNNLSLIEFDSQHRPWENCARGNITPKELGLTACHLAYVIYTSGSTGRPKGAMVEHRGLCNFIQAWKAKWQLNESDAIVQFSSISFDLSASDIFSALCSGARLVLRTDAWLSAEEFYQRCLEYGITYADIPTQFWKVLCQSGLPFQETLRIISVGGEALPESMIQQWLQRYPQGLVLCNCWGTTEAAVGSTAHEPGLGQQNRGSIGRPLPNNVIYILDTEGDLAPVGAVGELYIGGVQVARGYLNQPELSAACFLDDPFSSEPGARMQKTGDLGVWLADGTIEYLGRNDDQVKIRGFRVELGEIESALQACSGVNEAIVITQDTSAQIKRLVAYYTTQRVEQALSAKTTGIEPLDIDTLKAQLSAQLPEYMVPAAYVHLENFPLTANGKVDRKALPEADEDVFIQQNYMAPQNETEQTLADIWQDLLGVDRIGRNDNFFELGGHSLLAMQLIERLRRRGHTLLVKTLFNHPTLTALAESLAAGKGDKNLKEEYEVPPNGIPQQCARITPEMLPLVSLSQPQIDSLTATAPGGVANIQDIYPLAPLQEGIFFHHLLQEAGDPYITRAILAFAEQTQAQAFIEALQEVIQRHDILRTALAWEGLDEAVQVVWRDARLPVETLVIEADDVAAELQRRVDSTTTRINVAKAPMMAVCQAADPANNRWLLCLLNHHLCLDHTTLDLMMEEVQAFLSGRADRLQAPLPFRNFVARACLGVDSEAQAAYFCEQLGDVDEPSAPFGLLDVHSDGRCLQREHLPVTDALARQIRDRARQFGVSAASLFHLAWGLVVGATTGRDDVVFGTVLFGRMAGGEGADRVLGMFLNTLPLRLKLGASSVEDVLLATHARLAALLEHEHASLALAQQCSGVAAQTPLFTSLLNFRYEKNERYGEAGASLHSDVNGTGRSWYGLEVLFTEEQTHYPIALSVNDHRGEGFSLDVEVDESVDAKRLGAMMLEALVQAVDALEKMPSRPVRTLNVLPEQEWHRVLYGFNGALSGINDTHYGVGGNSDDNPSQLCIHELFEQQAKAHSGAVAVVYENQRLSYADLNEKANQLAYWLIEQGIRPDGLVAIALDRSPVMIVAILATLKAGGAYIPLDLSYPRERLRYMLSDSAPRVLITTRDFELQLGALPAGVSRVEVDGDHRPWEGCGRDNIAAGALGLTTRHLAYVIYTSGSTGQPKGVMVEHRSLYNLISAQCQYWQLSQSDRVIQFANVGFDYSVADLFGALCSGAALVLRTDAWISSAETFWEHCRQHEISYADIPTQYWKTLAHAGLPLPATLRIVCTGGEAVPEASLQEWFKHYPRGPHLANFYGPTEATVNATVHCPQAGEEKLSVIGRPLANTFLYILDNHRKPVPTGVVGELYIGGVQVARGYLNQPEQTAERFLENPFSGAPHARMYKTGDLGRWLADGTIEYLGRNDDQVKIRGFRVELGEIESALRACDGVGDAVVNVLVGGSDQQKRLVAYYTFQDALNIETLKAQLSARLPQYMVPAAYVPLEAIPLTANGKVDRKALPAAGEGDFIRQRYVAPLGEAEAILATIWQNLLAVEKVGRHDNFFELGGHSLLGTRLISQVRLHCDVELTLRQLFEHPTIAALAEAFALAADHQLPPIEKVVRTQRLPLSYAQQRLWFIDQLEGSSTEYNLPCALRLEGALDKAAFRQAFSTIIERHDILRTNIVAEEGEAYQVIHSECQLPLEEADLSPLDAAQQLDEVRRLGRADAEVPFNLQEDCLLRILLIKLSSNEHIALLNMHHIASDGWSLDILVKEFAAVYNAYRCGQLNPLPSLAVQYADYAQWQRRWLTGDVLQSQLSYWRKTLVDLPHVHQLPLDRPRPALQTFEGAIHHQILDCDLGGAIQALARRERVTLFMLLHTAFAVLLGRYSGETDVVMGSPIAGRVHHDVEPLIGFFVNTLVLRSDLGGNPAFVDLLQANKHKILDAYKYQHLPFEVLVDELNPKRSLNHSPLFQILFSMESDTVAALDLEGVRLSPIDLDYGIVKFDLELYVSEANDRLTFVWNYNQALFEADSIKRLSDNFAVLLEGITSQPTQTLYQFPLLSREEEQTVMHTWNSTGSSELVAQCAQDNLYGPLLRQIAVQGSKAAVKTSDKVLSYEELGKRSHDLACQLIAGGYKANDVKSNPLVAVVMEKGWQQVVAVLGILRAGAAYLPIEATLPRERISLLLQSGRVEQVVTTVDSSKFFSFDATSKGLTVLVVDEEPVLSQCRDSQTQTLDSSAPDDLAYVIFTSGSTGIPKGVMIDHRGALNTIKDINQRFKVVETDTMFGLSNLNFDLSVYDIFGVLGAGGTLVLPDPGEYRNPEAWLNYLQRDGITLWNSVPALMEMLVDYTSNNDSTDAFTDSPPLDLRLVLMSGDKIPLELPEMINKMIPAAEVISLGGATEASIWSIIYPIREVSRQWKSIPYGRPLANQQFYVLSRDLSAAPISVVGDLYIGGVGLARGYWADKEKTENSFITHPTLRKRLYKTGDLGRWTRNATIEFVGRSDSQVKIQGYRIELGEIEACIAKEKRISKVVVIAWQKGQSKRLVAYLVPHVLEAENRESVSGENIEIASVKNRSSIDVTLTTDCRYDLITALKQRLIRSLPNYMVPNTFIVINDIPLTPNGKVDYKSLPEPQDADLRRKYYMAPRNGAETSLCSLWKDLLAVDRVGIEDDFFELGGNSLKSIQFVSRARKVLKGKEISLFDFYLNPTIKAVVESLNSEKKRIVHYLHQLAASDKPEKLSLICLSYGGATGAVYKPLATELSRISDVVSTYEVKVPDVEALSKVDLQTQSIESIASSCAEEILDRTQGAIGVYGHCIGSSLGLEITRCLERYGRKVAFLMTGAALPSSKVIKYLPLSNPWVGVSDKKIISLIKSWGGISESIAPDIMQTIVLNFKRDAKLAFQYEKGWGIKKVKTPIYCVYSTGDPLTPRFRDRYLNWKRFSETVYLRVLENGNHYFLDCQAGKLAYIIKAAMEDEV